MNSVEAIQVGKRYGLNWVLRRVNLVITQGESIALLGNNGSGKTTLLKLMATLLRPNCGSLRVLDFDVRQKKAIRDRVRYLGHEKQLYGALSVLENLRLAIGIRNLKQRAEPEAMLNRLHLNRDQRVRDLSEGMKKRLVLARLLIGDADLILLDEPYPTLDREGRTILTELIRQWRGEGKTIILASHDHNEALAQADRVILLHEGSIRYDGKPTEKMPIL